MSKPETVTTTAEVENAKNTPAQDQETNSPSFGNGDFEEYHMSWRTGIAVLALALVFGTTTYAIAGPNFAIANMVQTFPSEAQNAGWIASAGLICAVTFPNIVGTTSDRYGKRWYLIVGCAVSIVGACVSGSARSMNAIIGGQVISGMGGSIGIVAVPAGMEVVPAKYRPLVFAVMGVFTGILGAVGGPFIFAACIQNNVGGVDGWRFGFYIQAILYGCAGLGILFAYNPPPTRFRREQSNKELLRSLDFVGIALLTVGFALIVVALIWGGQTYPWNSGPVIGLLVVGPLLVIVFGIYEWKGRKDGILHHDFFVSRNFPILLFLGAVDGMLLYGLSEFVPNQIRAIYTTVPLDVARTFTFDGGFLSLGYITIGIIITKLKRFKVALIVTNLLTTVFVGLISRSTPEDQSYFKGMLAAIGLLTAANTVVPVGGIALVVPSHLLATSNLILAAVRVIGGLLGLTIFSVVYNSKANVDIPQAVLPILTAAGVPQDAIPQIIGIVLQAPQALAQVPSIPPALLDQILGATAQASAGCYRNVWYCIMAASAACLVSTLFLVDVPERMTNQVESVLETQKILEKQVENV